MMPLFTDAIANLRGRPAPGPGDWSSMLGSIREGSIDLADGLSSSYSTIYRRSPWVNVSINKLARQTGRISLKAFEDQGGRRDRLRDGRLAELLRRPCPGWTPFRWKEFIVGSTATYGNAIVVKMGMDDETSEPKELFPAPSTGWTVGRDDTYVWTSKSGDKYPFKRWQIIHFRFWSTDENGFGISMLEPLRMTLANEDAAERFAFAAFKNGARPGSVLKTDQTLKQDVAEALKANLMAVHGGVDNAFKVAVLTHGLDWAPMPHNLADAAVIEHRKEHRELIAAIFDLPQPVVGQLENANFASIDILHTMLYQDTLGVWTTMIEETLQEDLVGRTPSFDGQFVEFDLNTVLRGDESSRFRNFATALTTGFMTANEIRQRENLPASTQPEADMLLFPMNLSGAVGAQVAEDTGQEDNQ